MLGRFGYSLDSYQTASFLLVSIPTCPSALLLGKAFRILWLYQLHTDFCLPKKKEILWLSTVVSHIFKQPRGTLETETRQMKTAR